MGCGGGGEGGLGVCFTSVVNLQFLFGISFHFHGYCRAIGSYKALASKDNSETKYWLKWPKDSGASR